MKIGVLAIYAMIPGFIFYSGCKNEPAPEPQLKSLFTTDKKVINQGDTVSFINHSENAFFYQWIFGDGGTSTDENPVHIFYDPGGFKILLRAIGSFTTDSSYNYVTVIPDDGKTIVEGKGIVEAKLGDTWSLVKAVLPPVDTNYHFSYVPNVVGYSNLVYYYKKGIGIRFRSDIATLRDQDSAYVISIVAPYLGITTKGIILGSTMSEVVSAYGSPEAVNYTYSYTAYYYASKGINFFTNNFVDTAFVSEIDILLPKFGNRIREPGNLQSQPELPAD
jgi:PKD repeat protein